MALIVPEASERTDVIVCGGGLAGLTAALTCLEAGAAVTLVEKAPELGGTTVLSGGLVWTFADYEKIREHIPAGDPALQWLVHDTVGDGRKWLAGHGAKLGPEESLLGHGWGQIMDPPQAVAILSERVRALGGTILLSTALHSLIAEDRRVAGIRVLRDGSLHELHAGAVVLATGGFQGNPELLSRYVLPDPGNLVLRANAWSTGDGLQAATAVGAAATSGLSTFYGHALVAAPGHYSKLEFRDVSQYYGQASVAINLEGDRFCDESDGLGEEIVNQHLARQVRGQGFYVIDSTILRSMPIEGLEVITATMIDRSRAAGAVIVEAETLEVLAEGMAAHGVPRDRVLATLKTYNEAVDGGRGLDLSPLRRRLQTSIATPPFYAVKVQAAITFTMGGIAIDEQGRVLSRAGSSSPMAPVPTTRAYASADNAGIAIGSDYRQSPIAGLYAAGCDSGNISHFGYMGGLATALTTGRAAGKHAAEFGMTVN